MESVVGVDLFVEGTENGIVLQKVREGFRIREIVNGHEFNVVAMQARRAQHFFRCGRSR